MVTVEQKLEAVLFYAGEALSLERLAKLLSVSQDEITDAAHILSASLRERGIRLLTVGNELELVTAPETSDVVTVLRKEELVRELGKAGAETLAVVLYKGPVSRADIEFVRGVNCSFILRNLLIRGLVERVPDPLNARSVRYQATPALLEHLGVTSVAALPDYDVVQRELAGQVADNSEEGSEPHHTEASDRI